MFISIGTQLTNPGAHLVPKVPVEAILADGWSATYPSPPVVFDPVTAPFKLALRRPGFSTLAAPVQRAEDIVVMTRVRQPYPNQASLTADRVALSDFVYAGEQVIGVANNSALVPPRPIACWLTPDLEQAQGAAFTARLAVAHAYARAGQAVAAVKFIASDGTNQVEQLVSTPVAAAFASGLHAPYFEANIDLTALQDGAICSLDAEIYPWVGAAFLISRDGAPYPSSNMSVLKFLNDRNGLYGAAYAYVDALGGSDVVGAAASDPTAAANTPFATVAGAAAAIKSFNQAQYGRNDTSGGRIRLVAGAHNHSNFSAANSGAIPLVIEAADPAAKASTIYQDGGLSVSAGCPGKLKFKDLTLRKIGASVIFLDNGATLATIDRMIVLENVTVDRNATSGYAAWIYRVGRMYLNDVDGDGDGLFTMFNGNACKQINAVGCAGAWGSDVIFNAVACRLHAMKRVNGFANIEQGRGQLFSHCQMTALADGKQAFDAAGAAIGPEGLAVIGSVMEQAGGQTGAAVRMVADGDYFAAENVLFIGNTVVGSRTNWLYEDGGSTGVDKRGFLRFTLNLLRNTKTDVFAQNGALVGNWPAAYNVGGRANVAVEGDNMGTGASIPGPGEWIGEVAALGDVYGSAAAPVATNFADDRSATGTMVGGGDYTPGAGHALPVIPAGMAPFAVDMFGRVLRDDGSDRIGALQPF